VSGLCLASATSTRPSFQDRLVQQFLSFRLEPDSPYTPPPPSPLLIGDEAKRCMLCPRVFFSREPLCWGPISPPAPRAPSRARVPTYWRHSEDVLQVPIRRNCFVKIFLLYPRMVASSLLKKYSLRAVSRLYGHPPSPPHRLYLSSSLQVPRSMTRDSFSPFRSQATHPPRCSLNHLQRPLSILSDRVLRSETARGSFPFTPMNRPSSIQRTPDLTFSRLSSVNTGFPLFKPRFCGLSDLLVAVPPGPSVLFSLNSPMLLCYSNNCLPCHEE